MRRLDAAFLTAQSLSLTAFISYWATSFGWVIRKIKTSGAHINSRKFEKLLLTEFPELRSEVEEWQGLEHLQMMEFVVFTKRAWKSGDWGTVRKCLLVADRLLRDGDSKIKNAVYVSYLESLPRKGKVHDRLRRMMTKDLRKGWDDILEYLAKLLRT